ncbi:signal transduction histidine kinase [Actinocrispum wychmicini]|uniref:histidine kinase n=1 Tax=Actinocrispum wychmicini TaxID=1213861 RepID=A0A4R2JFT7_9PSEU|nr:signal transduction histidine kinase [Actinocrispum wychmicini]
MIYRPSVDEHPRAPFTHRLTFAHLVAVDVVFAVLVGLNGWAAPDQLKRHDLAVELFVVLLVGVCSAVAIRRWRPMVALALTLIGYVAFAAADFTKAPELPIVLVLYVVALVEPMRVALAGLAAAIVMTIAGLVVANVVAAGVWFGSWDDWSLLTASRVSPLLAGWAVGLAVRRHRGYQESQREQADRQAQHRVDQAHRTVAEERLRIARELHDVVAHSMSVIAVQAGMGSHVIASQPDAAAKALAAIETTSRATLREMRALLGVLRDDTPDSDELPPTPGLADLPRMVARTERAGLRVEFSVRGNARELPPGVDLAAYRIIQEALTNVVKHARTDRGRVLVHYGENDVRIEVTDDGAGPTGSTDTGHGLIGMRERTALYGGEFSAGPLPLGGFRVAARLPTEVPG